eukprot:COSAG01_NODE_5874_length_3978_cov_2.018041_5_plen_121_part_00
MAKWAAMYKAARSGHAAGGNGVRARLGVDDVDAFEKHVQHMAQEGVRGLSTQKGKPLVRRLFCFLLSCLFPCLSRVSLPAHGCCPPMHSAVCVSAIASTQLSTPAAGGGAGQRRRHPAAR